MDHLATPAPILLQELCLLSDALTGLPSPVRGSSPWPRESSELLDVLERHEARFFLVGSRAERHPELVRAIVARG